VSIENGLEIGKKSRPRTLPGLPGPQYHSAQPGVMDGHCLLWAELLAAEAADALAIIHHGPFVYHSYGPWRAVALAGAAAVAIAVHDRSGASHSAVKAQQELGDSVGGQPGAGRFERADPELGQWVADQFDVGQPSRGEPQPDGGAGGAHRQRVEAHQSRCCHIAGQAIIAGQDGSDGPWGAGRRPLTLHAHHGVHDRQARVD